MDNPYEGNYYQSYKPVYTPNPEMQIPDGNKSLATASLVMGILSILSLCCFPPFLFVLAGLAILFACLSKGHGKRLGPAKAGMTMGIIGLSLMTIMSIAVCAFLMTSELGRSFFTDYFNLITSPDTTEEDLYDFLDKYLYENDLYDYNQNNILPYNGDEEIPFFNEDDIPDFYQEPESTPDGNFI